MKYLHLFLLFFCLLEIYGQRARVTTSTESSNNVDKPRGRGRSRFVVTDEFTQLTGGDASSNRRAAPRRRPNNNVESKPSNTETRERQRINTRPTPAAPRNTYLVEEVVNESPIDSFPRRSRPRILTETQFDSTPLQRNRPSLDVPIQTQARLPDPQIDELTNTFGSTAREILSARGQKLPEQITPRPDEDILSSIGEIARSLAPTRGPSREEPEEEYVFGNAARTLIASRGGVLPTESAGARLSQNRATPLRSETPILNNDDLRRSEIGAEPLPSLRVSDPESNRRAGTRGESTRTSSRQQPERVERPQSRSRTRSRTREDALPVRGPDPELTRQTLARGGPEIIERTPSRSQSQRIESNVVETGVEPLQIKESALTTDEFETQKESSNSNAPLSEESRNLNSDVQQILEENLNIDSDENRDPEIHLFREEVPQEREESQKPLFREDIESTRNFVPTTSVRSTQAPQPLRKIPGRTRSRVEAATEEAPEIIQPVFRANSVENYVKFDRTTEEPIIVDEPKPRKIQSEISQPRRTLQVEEVASRRNEEVAPRRIQIPSTQQTPRRIQISSRTRGRSNIEPEESVTSSTRTRAPRTRVTSRSDDASLKSSRSRPSTRIRYEEELPAESRTRVETRTRGPSVFLANDGEITSRSRSGRRIESAPQRFTIDLSATTRRSRSSARATTISGFPEKQSGNGIIYNEQLTRNGQRQRSANSRFTSRETSINTDLNAQINSKEESRGTSQVPNVRKRGGSKVNFDENPRKAKRLESDLQAKSRYLELPLGIDESKLEVLPLFETEPKLVAPANRFTGRSNQRQSTGDFLELPPTERGVKFIEKSVANAATRVSATRTEGMEPKTIPTTQRRTARTTSTSSTTTTTVRPPLVRESVIAEYNEVTSKSTIRKKGGKSNRGNKKAEIKLEGAKKKKSEEEVDEEDNYPEPFKALIQAKKKENTRSTNKDSSTLKNIVTSSTTTRPASSSSVRRKSNRPQLENARDNEIEPKPTKSVQPTSSTSTTRRRYQPSKTTETKPKPTVTTQTRKNNSKNAPEFKPRRKALRSTAVPPSTTPLPSISGGKPTPNRFSAKFVKKEPKNLEEKNNSSSTKGLYSSKRVVNFDKTEKFIEKSTPLPIKKINRYSSKYRSELLTKIKSKSTTGAPFYVPTVPTPVYVPTVPTVTPPQTTVTPTRNARKHEEYESITFIDEQNDIPSDNLVQDGTTEKTVSIIERIINSITAISTTASPNSTAASSTKTTTDLSENSAILKLATKKSTNRQTDDSVTSEKPTTKIIEKILVSLNAIQSNEVGTAPGINTVSSSSTTPLSPTIVTKSKYSAKYRGSSLGTTLPALSPASTSVSPLSVFDEIDEKQVLEKRTIGKLLDILNGLANPNKTPREYVIVTPKNSNVGTTLSFSQPDSTASSQTQEPSELPSIATTTSNTIFDTQSTSTYSQTEEPLENDSVTSTSPNPTTGTESNESTKTDLVASTEEATVVRETTPTGLSTNSTQSTETTTMFTTSNEISDMSSSSTENNFVTSSILPKHRKFEVSPGSVSVYSANDLSHLVTLSDVNTVTISSRVGTSDNSLTSSTDLSTSTTTEFTTESTTMLWSTTEVPTVTTFESTTEEISSTTSASSANTTSNRAGKLLSGEINEFVSNSIDITPSSTTSSTTPDYYVFAVLNNNTILRKKPPTLPNKEVPFLIVGLYPNNTVIKRFPNGTIVPMEQIIKVSGFDTRPNPPPLPEITSNQVTDPNGLTTDDANRVTVDSDRMPKELQKFVSPSLDVRGSFSNSTENTRVSSEPTMTTTTNKTAPSNSEGSTTTTTSTTTVPITTTESTTVQTTISTTGSTTLIYTTPLKSSTVTTQTASSTTQSSTSVPSSLNEFLNDKTVEALNNIIKTDDVSSTKAPQQVNKYNEVLNIQDLINKNTQNRWKPVLSPVEVEIRTVGPPGATTANIRKAPYAPETSTVDSTSTTQFTTTEPTTTTFNTVRIISQPPSTSIMSTARRSSTVMPEVVPKYTTPQSVLIPSTILPSLISTLFPSLIGGSTAQSGLPGKLSTDIPTTEGFEIFTVSATTAQPTSVAPPLSTSQRISTTTPITSTTESTSMTSTTESASTTKLVTTTTTTKKPPTTKKLKQLTEEQKKNLEEIAKLERQQAELLRQLNFLTSVFGGPNVKLPNSTAPATKGGPPSDLASRILSVAKERNKAATKAPAKASSTTTTTTLKPTDKRPNSIQDQLPTTSLDVSTRTTPSLEEILKQYNLSDLSTPEPLTSTYGKSDEAILATILKQQGIEPTTPKVLADQLKEAGSTTKKPKPRPRPRTTPRPGRLMQGLNWLLDLLDPPTTKRPATRKATTKRRTTKATTTANPETTQQPDKELLTHQPTRLTPIVTLAPIEKITQPSLSQEEIQSLIKQLEAAQEDPKAANEIDFSKIKSLQTLLDVDEGVQVTSSGNNGATSRFTDRAPKRTKSSAASPVYKSTTPVPSSVSNRIEDEEESFANNVASTTVLPPVSLNPIPGVDDRGQGDNFIRSNLLNAAVGVTRAISNFFSSAIQGARQSFRSVLAGAASGTSGLSG